MATSFKGWADSWGNSWGSVVFDPNAMRGSASFSITASLQVAAGDMQGAASFAITASLQLPAPPASAFVETPRYSQAVKDHAHWKQMREEDDVILALIQHFVMET